MVVPPKEKGRPVAAPSSVKDEPEQRPVKGLLLPCNILVQRRQCCR